MKKLCVHPGKRYLMTTEGEPFFYMGDTAWEIFHRLTRSEAVRYMDVRAEQGFNVIQSVALAEFEGLTVPNAHGRLPLKFKDGQPDPTHPDLDGDYSYWDHVDYIVSLAAERNMFIGLLPTWGDKFNKAWGQGPEIFTPENAAIYGEWIANRYKDCWNIIWMLGGDRPLQTQTHRDVIDVMGQTIRKTDPDHLITFHPSGCRSSTDDVAGKDYIDFHTVQSSHGTFGYQSHLLVRRTGEAEEKPFMDSESRYEDHPASFTEKSHYFWNDDDVRQNLYWNMLEGVCGNTYGNHCIWYMNSKPTGYFPITWHDALKRPGAEQFKFVAKLRLSRPFFELRRAPELVQDDNAAMAHFSAARGEKYAYIYTPLGLPIRAYLDKFSGGDIRALWFDPRTGEEEIYGIFPPCESLFVPKSSGKGNDWVLILESID